MNILLFTQELEPITVIDLPVDVIKELETKGPIKVQVYSKDHGDNEPTEAPQLLTLYAVRITWNEVVKHFIIAREEELALSVQPSFLPGQLAMVNDLKQIIAEKR